MFDTLPAELAEMPPGPELARVLATVDITRLSGHDRVVVLRAHQRMRSHHAAAVYRAMSAISDALHHEDLDDAASPDDYEAAEMAAAAEIRAALRLTRRTADAELAFAHWLRGRLPAVGALLAAGGIDVARARVLVRETLHLPEETARQVVASVLPRAPGWTTSQLRQSIRRLCITAHPEDAAARYHRSVKDRSVGAEPDEDGTASIEGRGLPPDRVAAAMRHVNHLARSLRRRGETRSMDQLRADVFLDLLTGHGRPHGGRGTVDLRVDVATLVGLAEDPGDLGGYGLIVADLARRLATDSFDAEWRFGITDPDTGRLVHTGSTRRRPTAAQRRQIQTRDETCIFPGCIAPATDCDLDHATPWSQGGATEAANLSPTCRRDHVLRHAAGWTYRALDEVDYIWTSRLGHRYTTSGRSP